MENKLREDIKNKFLNPANEVRSFPFWGWNGALEPEEIRRQINVMHKQGFGGFFIHSREGLETVYMGEEWNECILAAVDEAKKLGMYVWLYDEDRFPSGTAGGKVTAGGDAYRCKGLTLEVNCNYSKEVWKEENLLAVYFARLEENKLLLLKRIQKTEKQAELPKGMVCLVARLEVSAPSEWFNNEAPPDNLNSATAKRFISLTHKKYYELCGEEFGKTIRGIFTDEPSLCDRHASFHKQRGWIPWTYGFDTYFKENRGYDPLETIPYLYFEGEKTRKIRHDYWRSLGVRYRDAYIKVIGTWCQNHHLFFTGHCLQEDKLGLTTRVNGAPMPLYEYLQVPGIDMLMEKTEEFMTVRQCASVANQLGKKAVLSETYGCTGWDFSMEGQRWIGDWQYVLGVNLRCQHIALYSITGCRKRDYPPVFNYNTTWFDKAHVTEDYFARLSAVLSEGKAIPDLLLLHPASTAWSRLGTNPYGNPVRRLERDVPAIDAYGYQFNELIKDLSFHHFNMDLGDETILSEHAMVKDASMQVGLMNYVTLVLPPMDTILRSTYELLVQYVNQGGQLLVMTPSATMIEGETDNQIEKLWRHSNCIMISDTLQLLAKLESMKLRKVRILDSYAREETHCLTMLRTTGDDKTLFIVNNDREHGYEVTIEITGDGSVEELNPLSGEISLVETMKCDGYLRFQTGFGNADSKLYRILDKKSTTKKEDSVYAGYIKNNKKSYFYDFPNKARISLTMENTFIIDRCRYQLGSGPWSKPMEIWAAQRDIREQLKMRPTFYHGIEQRYRWIHQPCECDGTKLEIELTFTILRLPETNIYFAMEHPEEADVICNGCIVKKDEYGYLIDRGIKKLQLCNLKEGENTIILSYHYRNATELENYYLCGEFGVDMSRRIVEGIDTLFTGDWTRQGLYHYAGGVIYHYTFPVTEQTSGEVYLELTEFRATCLTVRLNGHEVEVPWKAAGNLRITDWIKEGDNELSIEVTSSPRNLFGPFHLTERKQDTTNDASFRPEGIEYTKNYNVVEYGLMMPPRLYYKA